MTRDDVLAFADRGFFQERDFTTALGLVRAQGFTTACLRSLLGKKHIDWSEKGPSCECGRFRWMDHPVAYRDNFSPEGTVDVIVWFPYWLWEEHKKQYADTFWAGLDVFAWAEEHGVNIVELPHGTGWYGGYTVMVVMWRDKEVSTDDE